ncbi:MAG: 50S ribosomal protein L13 [Candidatus Heimdallarchaeota archaeon]|nr:MAG: 50S ribosomal protein L13 [Candidatus Heimdallarchaeota archaeon]
MIDDLLDATIIDAENSILGRLSSIIAKRLLKGEKIIIINANKGLISGGGDFIAAKYLQRWRIKTKSNPLKGPFHPREADKILKRTIRGMLPYHKSRGKEAYHRLVVYKDFPETLREKDIEIIPETQKINPKASYISLGQLRSKI